MNDKIEDPQEGIKAEQEARGNFNGIRHQQRESYKRKDPKILRNAPCPCASGKKYKNCCEIRARLSEQASVIEIRKKREKK